VCEKAFFSVRELSVCALSVCVCVCDTVCFECAGERDCV
jgi:hypothetical protein